MQDDKFKRNLYRNSRINIDFFMFAPTALYQSNISTYTLKYNPIIMIKRINPNSANDGFQEKDTFKVNPRNLFKVIKFFNKIVTWFFDKSKEDLFLRDEDDNLIFNADYNKLSASVGADSIDAGAMKAIPALIELGGSKKEGVNLYINTLGNIIQLTSDEIGTIFELFRDFSFADEITCDLAVYNYIKSYDNIETDISKWNSNKGNPRVQKNPVSWGK
jgi:hypothetical protein